MRDGDGHSRAGGPGLGEGEDELTLGRFELLLFLSLLWFDLLEAVEARGWTLPARPTAGDMDRKGTLGGGPGSAPGERRKERCEEPGACMVTVALTDSQTGPSPSCCSIAEADGCIGLDCENQVVMREERRGQGRGETGPSSGLNHRLGLDAVGAEAKESVKSEAGSGEEQVSTAAGLGCCCCTVGSDAVVDDLCRGGLVWFGESRMLFLVSGFWFQQMSRHGLSPAVMPGQNPWRHDEALLRI